MLLNAYDTTVGKTIAVSEQIKGTLRTLALMEDLVKSPKNGVFFIDHDNGGKLPLFMFPLSVQGHDRKFITVLDRRPFVNRNGVVINPAEYSQVLVTAYIQQDMQENNFTIIRSTRELATRAYARSLSNRIGRQAGLDDQEQLELLVFLGLFHIYQSERSTTDYDFVARNVLKQALTLDSSITFPLIEEMGYINDIEDFVDFLRNRDAFFKLKNMTKKDFISLGSSIWFSSLSRFVMGAALEHVPSFVGICYATTTNKMYLKTTLGSQIDPKYNERLIESFARTINMAYPMGDK